MESIEGDVDGLSLLGAECERRAEVLSAHCSNQPCGPAFQATSTAVEDVLAIASRAGNLISMRLRVTGHAVVEAADRLADCDSRSRARIAAIGGTPTMF
jgi:hypothetical protein